MSGVVYPLGDWRTADALGGGDGKNWKSGYIPVDAITGQGMLLLLLLKVYDKIFSILVYHTCMYV